MPFQNRCLRLLTMSMESIVVLIIGLALKYVFFDTKEEFDDHVLQNRRSFGKYPPVERSFSWKVTRILIFVLTAIGVQVERSSQTEGEDVHRDVVTNFTQTEALDVHHNHVGDEVTQSIHTQTDISYADEFESDAINDVPCRTVEECKQIYLEQVR